MTDWTVLQIEGVADVAHHAAAKVARQYHRVAEYDDLHQDALILLASNPDTVRTYVSDPDKGLGYLHRWLWCDLTNAVKTEAKRQARHVSYELARAGAE